MGSEQRQRERGRLSYAARFRRGHTWFFRGKRCDPMRRQAGNRDQSALTTAIVTVYCLLGCERSLRSHSYPTPRRVPLYPGHGCRS